YAAACKAVDAGSIPTSASKHRRLTEIASARARGLFSARLSLDTTRDRSLTNQVAMPRDSADMGG
ncbi:MAG: hypothetical protein ACLFN3_05665, partial [Halochromatium sp.]